MSLVGVCLMNLMLNAANEEIGSSVPVLNPSFWDQRSIGFYNFQELMKYSLTQKYSRKFHIFCQEKNLIRKSKCLTTKILESTFN